jgi:PTH1 family peptidyl-tRNA hydrolase
LLVVHDDLDLPVGRLRIVVAAGSGGHRGVHSIQETLGTTEFGRIRIGIGRPEPGTDAADRVLADVPSDDRAVLLHAVTEAAEAVRNLITEGPARAMNRYNVRPRSDAQPQTRGTDQGQRRAEN